MQNLLKSYLMLTLMFKLIPQSEAISGASNIRSLYVTIAFKSDKFQCFGNSLGLAGYRVHYLN
jgi:hypothetical protein